MYEFFRNTKLNANAYCFTALGVPCEKPKFNQNQFGGTFGGPIKKDRTFFFTSYEGRRIRQGIPSPAVTVPTAAERPDPSPQVNGHIVADFSEESPFRGTLSSSYAFCNRRTESVSDPAVNRLQVMSLDIPSRSRTALTTPTSFRATMIPLECMDATAVDLLQFVPIPRRTANVIQTVPVQPTAATSSR